MNFRWLFHYIKLIHNSIYYRVFSVEGRENIPPQSDAVIIASCHQNAINDPLSIEFAFENRTVNLFARGSLFNNRFLNYFFRSIHVIPAYRMRTDGEESLSKNYTEFDNVEERLFNNEWAGIFPEATNQTRHYLGEFSLGYLRMAFQAAEKQNFEKDVKILPVAIHYDNYHRFRHRCLVRIAPAISLQPLYELYKTKPRTAQRQANAMVRESIHSMMLDIQTESHYEAIDYIRESYGIRYAAQKGLDPRVLSQKLDSDIKLAARMEQYLSEDEEGAKALFSDVLKLKKMTLSRGVRDWVLCNKDSNLWLSLYGVTLLCLLPLFLFALIPNLLIYIAPIPLCKKMDSIGGPFVMFKGGVQIVVSALITAPLLYIIYFIISLIYLGWLHATIFTLLQPMILIFGWEYYEYAKKYLSLIRYRFGTVFARKKTEELLSVRREIWNKLDEICLKNCK